MKELIKNLFKKATDFSGSKSRKATKGVIGVIILLLLGALGLEIGNKDFSLSSILSGNSVKDSEIQRDEKGNLQQNKDGDFITKIIRDKTGKEVPEGTEGAKYTDEYNCDDFKTQVEARTFFDNAGGVKGDTNRLDGDKDGEACENLPVK